jgi:hypothetical protein
MDSARLIQAAPFLDSIVAHWTHAADFCSTIAQRADVLSGGNNVLLLSAQSGNNRTGV